MLSLKPRLALCAELVRPAKALADVGTDHAYLPIWLLISGKTPRALACDINRGPLESARRSARLYGVEDRLKLVQSDGLKQVSREDAEDVVIAGMGGELILRIAGETPWLRDPRRRLILQPMTRADKLRAGLWDLGFRILRERAAEDGGRFYSAFSAEYAGNFPPCSPIWESCGPGSRRWRNTRRKPPGSWETACGGRSMRGIKRARRSFGGSFRSFWRRTGGKGLSGLSGRRLGRGFPPPQNLPLDILGPLCYS